MPLCRRGGEVSPTRQGSAPEHQLLTVDPSPGLHHPTCTPGRCHHEAAAPSTPREAPCFWRKAEIRARSCQQAFLWRRTPGRPLPPLGHPITQQSCMPGPLASTALCTPEAPEGQPACRVWALFPGLCSRSTKDLSSLP